MLSAHFLDEELDSPVGLEGGVECQVEDQVDPLEVEVEVEAPMGAILVARVPILGLLAREPGLLLWVLCA